MELTRSQLEHIPGNATILEIGSRNINGSVRSLLEPRSMKYVGVDLIGGEGVDIILDVLDLRNYFGDESFDVVVSTEMLEHCSNWKEAIYQMASVLRVGGVLIITTRSPGFELHDYPSDYWRFTRIDFSTIFSPIGELICLLDDMTLGWPCGIGIAITRTANHAELPAWRERLNSIEVYSMDANSQFSGEQDSRSTPIIFDQFSRYKACADLLRQAGLVSGNAVLDIGSGPECLFGKFLSDASVTFVDPLIPSNSGVGKIKGDVFASELDAKSFDYVTAVDVLEHVPKEHRQAFIARLAALAKNTVILAFPAGDARDAIDADDAIDSLYRSIYAKDYPWLEEHHRFGLPALVETVEQLRRLGWHCQSIGHGHIPWLKDLLGFVICVWDIPEMKNLVLEISEKFNSELYPYDFQPPHYRRFVVASRNPLDPISVPVMDEAGFVAAENNFYRLIDAAYQQYFAASLRLIETLKTGISARDTVIAEREAALAERDAAVAERDAAVSARDTSIAQLNLLINSYSWQWTRPLRFIARIARHGLIREDRRRFTESLRDRYHRLPLPMPVKQKIAFVYHGLLRKTRRLVNRRGSKSTQFHAPSSKPASRQMGKPDYVIWGVIDWHFRYQRPQQLASALVDTGRRVLYVSPNLEDDKQDGFIVEAIGESNRLFQIKLFARGAHSIYLSAPGSAIVEQLRRSFGEVLDWADCQQVVSLVHHPFWYDVARVLPNSRLVYDCMDHHEGFGNNAENVLRLEKSLSGEADLTITTSSWLDEAIAPHAQRRGLIRNAGDFDHFSKPPSSIHRDPLGRRIIGYYGAIAEWFDVDLVEAVAKQYPEYCVLLIGTDTVNAKRRLGKLTNVSFSGEVPYSQLPHYLHGFDVCILPFKVIQLTLATNPVKVYEYLSAGKPVVTVNLPEISQFDGLVYSVSDKGEFLETVGRVLDRPEPEDLIRRRRTFARTQTWKQRVSALTDLSESSADDPRVSVVVVTYNNLDLTRACLASLDQYSHYENLEVLVVDNASSDHSREFLINWAENGNRRRLILNDDNKGFAAANNQGLAIASGDYLVLLNNDTHVTPGWIRTLVKHLERDKSIGLIGPVTNNIGNEAMIDIQYADMAEMLVKSAAYSRRHIGQLYPLSTAAFFCVMMARETYERVGPLDEAFGIGFFEDDDYCRRIEQAGLRVVCAEDVFVHHHLSASFDKLKHQERQKLFEKNRRIYEAKWGEWVPHGYRHKPKTDPSVPPLPSAIFGRENLPGQCNVCGRRTRFFYEKESLWRESLNCQYCRTTSRYRSITRGILRAIYELTGICANSLTELPRISGRRLYVYDTQPPFYYEPCAYPLPDLLKATGWIDLELSQYKPNKPLGEVLAPGVTNQNLECLTFPDESLDIVITSDVIEHVRLDNLAHKEIHRVLKPHGIYIFTVPHNRAWNETLTRVQIVDPEDPSKDLHLLEPEYHGDTNCDEALGILAYRTYGKDLETELNRTGFTVEYIREDIEHLGILNTELYYCRKIGSFGDSERRL